MNALFSYGFSLHWYTLSLSSSVVATRFRFVTLPPLLAWFLSLTLCETPFASQSEGTFAVILTAAFRLPLCRHPFSSSSLKFGGMTDCFGTVRYLIQEPNLVPMEGASVPTGHSFAKFFHQQRVHLQFLSGSTAHNTC